MTFRLKGFPFHFSIAMFAVIVFQPLNTDKVDAEVLRVQLTLQQTELN